MPQLTPTTDDSLTLDRAERVESETRTTGTAPLSRSDPLLQRAFTSRFVLHMGDATMAIGAVVGALWAWSAIDGQPWTLQYVQDRAPWFALAGVWLLLLQLASASHRPFVEGDIATLVARTVAAGIGLYLALYFLAPRDLLPRLVVLNFLALAGVATLAWRVVHRRLSAEDGREGPVAVVGAGRVAREIAALLQASTPRRQVLGLFRSAEQATTRGAANPPRDGLADLQRVVARRQVSALILAPEGPMEPEVLRTVVRAREHDIDVIPMQAVYEQVLRRVPIRYSDATWVLESLADPGQRWSLASRFLKRAVDVVGGCAGCALLLMLLPVLGPLIRLDVRAPVFYRQERLGLAGCRFQVLKFRTMGLDAEHDGARWAAADDSRASRFGRFLRRSRLDEIPQFWNVLRGEMSLVGPRPERPEFDDEWAHRIPCWRERLRVRPGLSGWAQTLHHYSGSVDALDKLEYEFDKLEYDLYYIKYWSLWFDAVIIGRTLWTVATLRGR